MSKARERFGPLFKREVVEFSGGLQVHIKQPSQLVHDRFTELLEKVKRGEQESGAGVALLLRAGIVDEKGEPLFEEGEDPRDVLPPDAADTLATKIMALLVGETEEKLREQLREATKKKLEEAATPQEEPPPPGNAGGGPSAA